MARRLIVFLLLGQFTLQVNEQKIGHFRQPLDSTLDRASPSFEISAKTSPIFNATCTPWDSCRSRCGQPPRGLPYLCNCDSQCPAFRDCCVDFENYCSESGSVTTTDGSRATCRNLLLFPPWNVFTVSECLPSHGTDVEKALCGLNLPTECVVSRIFEGSTWAGMLRRCEETTLERCQEAFRAKCDSAVEPRCEHVAVNECKRRSRRHCRKCEKDFWPVRAPDGLLYKNAHCAACNEQSSHTAVDLEKEFIDFLKGNQSLGSFRSCLPSIGTCPPQNSNFDHLSSLCPQFLSPVVASNILYKNTYCALCNGVQLEETTCPDFPTHLNSNVPHVFYSFFNLDMMDEDTPFDVFGMNVEDLPAAFSILLNFGLDGRERMLFSSDGQEEMMRYQRLCGSGFIWDPFSKICRKLYCSTEFVLENFKCVKKETTDESEGSHDSIDIPDTKSTFVHLSLSAEVEIFDFLQFIGMDDGNITQSIRESLAMSFNISEDRIQNINFNISVGNFSNWNDTLLFIQEEMEDTHPIIFIIDFDLHETLEEDEPEPSVDSIVSMLAAALSVQGFEFDVSNVRGRIFEIHQTSNVLQSWCDSGQKLEYWNSDFSLILNEDEDGQMGSRVSGVYVNKTGKFYGTGEFVANILVQGYQFSNNMINVSGLVVVCDQKKKLNSSCTRVLLQREEYAILENGSLYFTNRSNNSSVMDDSSYEEGENDTIFVCLMSQVIEDNSEGYNLEMDYVQIYVSTVLLYISVIAMAAVLVTYCLFKSLRNLPGCITINLTFSLLVMQLTFLIGQRGTVTGDWCRGVAHFFHYVLLCSLTWMNVMAFDLYKTFGSGSVISHTRSKMKHLPRYMAYAYGAPLLVILVTFFLDTFAADSRFAPHYGFWDLCWINSRTAAILFFATPLALIMLANFVLCVLTIRAIRVVQTESQLSEQRRRRHVLLYARLALVTGLTWALAFAAAYVRTLQLLTYLFIVCNNLQGLFLFCIFLCNRRVLGLYATLLGKWRRGKDVVQTVARVAKAMRRTISTDTVVSSGSASSDTTLPAVPE